MPTASKAKLQYEASQTAVAMAALTDSGDRTTFEAASSPFSRATNHVPVIRPNGLISGGAITPAISGTDDLVDVAAGTAYIGGALVSWSADTDVAAVRGVTTDTHSITSITVTSLGAVAAVAGTDGTEFVETRDAAGGPPLIAVTSIEIGQVRTTSVTSADIVAAEIFATIGVHQERYDYPLWAVDYYNGEVIMDAALPAIHTGAVAKKVCASYSVPSYAEIRHANDFVAPETSYSISSTQVYNAVIGESSESLSAGSFTAYLEDGVSDALVSKAGENLWFRFYPNRHNASYVMAQGILGVGRTFPAGGNISAACTINAETAVINVSA
jgi:hypothetical protein